MLLCSTLNSCVFLQVLQYTLVCLLTLRHDGLLYAPSGRCVNIIQHCVGQTTVRINIYLLPTCYASCWYIERERKRERDERESAKTIFRQPADLSAVATRRLARAGAVSYSSPDDCSTCFVLHTAPGSIHQPADLTIVQRNRPTLLAWHLNQNQAFWKFYVFCQYPENLTDDQLTISFKH